MNKKDLIISLAIAIIFAFFIGYGIEVFQATPTYEDFCKQNLWELTIEKDCVAAGGEWTTPRYPNGPGEKPIPQCIAPSSCQNLFEAAQLQHDRIVFIIAIIAGVATLILSAILTKDVVSFGLVLGGLLSVLYGTLRYWQHANEVLKFVLLGIALGILIWFSYKKLK